MNIDKQDRQSGPYVLMNVADHMGEWERLPSCRDKSEQIAFTIQDTLDVLMNVADHMGEWERLPSCRDKGWMWVDAGASCLSSSS
jgi:hypothetical protein